MKQFKASKHATTHGNPIDSSKSHTFLIIVPLNILEEDLIPPLGPICLRSFARQHGFNGEIMDFNTLIKEEMIDDYDLVITDHIRMWLNANPQAMIIGISVIFSGVFPRALKIAEIIKSLDKKRLVVLGGAHPTIHYREILDNCPVIDQVIVGEGEWAFVELLHSVYGTKTPLMGLSQRRPIFAQTTTKRTIGDLGLTDYSDIDYSKYHRPDMRHWYNPKGHEIICSVPIISTRSCPFDCNFCSVHAVHGPPKSFRQRPAADVIEEMRRLYNDFGIRYFSIFDDCTNANKKAAMELYSGIAKSELNVSLWFPCGLRPSTLDGELIDAMAAAGMIRTAIAIESGSDFIRNKVIGKSLSIEKIFEVYNYFMLHHPDIWVLAFFIVGLPEETNETLDETEELAKALEWVTPFFYNAVPFPGTRLWDQCLKDDLLLFPSEDAWRACGIYGWGNKPIPWTAKNAGVTFTADTFVIRPYNMSLDDLKEHYMRLTALSAQRIVKVKEHLFSRLIDVFGNSGKISGRDEISGYLEVLEYGEQSVKHRGPADTLEPNAIKLSTIGTACSWDRSRGA